MIPPGGSQPVAGICHARGVNAALPAQWMIYITVDNLDEAVAACRREGGEVIVPPKEAGGMGRYGVIKDPAGAVAALFEHVRK
jgi:predicted enzyme related to lactoylglutathione lyase